MKLVGALEEFPAAPFVVLAKNFRMLFDEALRMAREHHIFAAGQRVADAFEGLPPHHNDIAHGHLLKPLEVLGQIPWDFSLRANHAV